MADFNKEYASLNYLIKTKGIKNCLDDINEMLDRYPNSGYVLLKKACYYVAINDKNEAEYIYNQILEGHSNTAKNYAKCELFKLYIGQDRIEDAEKMFSKIDSFSFDKYEYSYFKSILMRKKNNYDDASDLMLFALQSQDERSLLNYLIEIQLNYSERFKKINYAVIKKVIRKVYNVSSGKKKALIVLLMAQLESLKCNYPEALRLYRSIISTKNEYVYTYVIIGICKIYLLLEDEDLLNLVEFEELQKLKGIDKTLLVSQIYFANRDYTNAIEVLNEFPNEPKIMYEKAKLLIIQKEYDKALDLYKKVFKETSSDILKSLSIFNISYIYIQYNDYESALNIIEKNQSLLLHIDKTKYYQAYAYLCKCLNLKYELSAYNSYSIKQILNYDINVMYKHIEKHIDEFKELIEFNDVSELISNFVNMLDSSNMVGKINLFDIYILKYPGKRGENVYIKLIVVPKTKNIITCFASKTSSTLLDDTVFEDEVNVFKPKQKVIQRKSQIEKFKEKYNM